MRRSLYLLLCFFGIGACLDPVTHDEQNALGGEIEGIEPGPRHRSGQPCLTCHGDERTQTPVMMAAGTVFRKKGSNDRAEGAVITISDAKGKVRKKTANDRGNFYVTVDEWPDPVYPLESRIDFTDSDGAWIATMVTRIGRNADCNRCHQGDGDPSHAQRTYADEVRP